MYALYEPVKSPRSLAKNMRGRLLHGLLSRRVALFQEFITENLPLSAQVREETVSNQLICDQYRLVVCGSDQIWNVNAGDFSEVYLLPFPNCVGKIAYGPSMNNGDFANIPELDYYRELLLNFDAISVREASGRDKLLSLLSGARDIRVVADPTLLLDREQYSRVCSPVCNARPYIFLYTVKNSDAVVEAALEVAGALRLPVVTLFTGNGTYRTLMKGRGAIRLAPSQGPGDFLGLMAGAEFVVTDSFHGTAFSLLYGKRFAPVDGAQVGRPARHDTRVGGLLEILGLEDLLSSSIATLIRVPIDYEIVDERRRKYARESRAFLEEALSATLARLDGDPA